MDGRVRVTFENEQIEDQVWLRTKPAAVKDMAKGGLWLDLTKIEHAFAEENQRTDGSNARNPDGRRNKLDARNLRENSQGRTCS